MKTSTIPAIYCFRLPTLAAVLLALAPWRAAADPAAIFVGNFGGKNVPAYSATGAAATGYTAPAGFSEPDGVAYNPANNTLYVADGSAGEIRTFNAATGAETTASTGFASTTGLSNPQGFALNAGVLYAANESTNTVTAYNAATGVVVTSGFKSPAGLNQPTGLAVGGTMLYIANNGGNGGNGSNTLGAYNLVTGTAVSGFTPITGLNNPFGVALYGNDLFVANFGSNTVGEYDATTGAVINTAFLMNLKAPDGLAILGNQLLVVNDFGTTVGAYGIPAVATAGNVPTSSNANFITGLNQPTFIAVVPEPSTWALLGLGAAGLGLAALRRCAARV